MQYAVDKHLLLVALCLAPSNAFFSMVEKAPFFSSSSFWPRRAVIQFSGGLPCQVGVSPSPPHNPNSAVAAATKKEKKKSKVATPRNTREGEEKGAITEREMGRRRMGSIARFGAPVVVPRSDAKKGS